MYTIDSKVLLLFLLFSDANLKLQIQRGNKAKHTTVSWEKDRTEHYFCDSPHPYLIWILALSFKDT